MTGPVRADSLVTLHYRLAAGDGPELVSTFGATPATLQLGNGELAPPLEACLLGLAPGERRVFELEPARGFGERDPQLVRRLPRGELPPSAPVEPGSVVEFPAPGGGVFAGRLREIDDTSVLMDFNHPLAGHPVRFEVEIVGVL